MGALIYGRRRLGDRFSEGARLLWLAMLRQGLSQESLRAELGRPKGVIGRWLLGDRLPDGESRGRLFKRFGIKPQAWDQKPSKPFSLETAA
jgi:hypothetical protein